VAASDKAKSYSTKIVFYIRQCFAFHPANAGKIIWLGVMQNFLQLKNINLSQSHQTISGIDLAKESGLFQWCKAGMRETDRSE